MPVIARSAAASMGGTIELNFYLEIPEKLLNDKASYVTMEKGTKSTKALIKDAPKTKVGGKTVRRFTIPVNAKEMRDEIVIRAYDGNGKKFQLRNGSGNYLTDSGVTYSVSKYCEAVIASSTDAKMVKLATAMMDYGTASQIYFGYNADGLEIDPRVRKVGKQTIIDAYSTVKTGTAPTGVAGLSLSISLENNTRVRVYLTYADGVGSGRFAYYVDGDKKSITKTSGGKFYLEKTGIPAKSLDQPIEFTVSGQGKSQTVKVSALSYAAMLCNSGVDKSVWLGKALYLYNQAAKAYFAK